MSLQDYNSQTNADASLIQNHSEFFRSECMRLMEETNKACRRMQDDAQKRLDQRLNDIHFLKKELEQKLEEIILEMDRLITIQGRVHKALEACKDPLKAAVQCIDERIKSTPQETFHNNVNRELLKEQEAIEGVVVVLQRVVLQLTEQIRLNRSAKYHLEKNLKEKFEAQSIDNLCILMTPHSDNTDESQNNSSQPSLSVTPMQWKRFSDINLTKAEQQRCNSMSMRALVESLLEQTASDLQKQFKATNLAFQLNIQELKKDKGQMEDHQSKILLEYNKQQTICEELKVSIKERERSLSLAKARLSLRHKRPPKEQCFDPAQANFLNEIQQLNDYITKLHEAVAQSHEEQRALVRCQIELQENIDMKSGALYIDEVLCSQHRESIIIQNF